MAALYHVFVRQLLKRAYGGNVLNEIAALAVAYRYVFDALLGSEKCLDNGNGVRNARGNERTRKRAVWLSVYGNTGLLIYSGKTVDVLPIAYRPFHRDVLCIRQIIRDSAAFVARESSCVRYLRQKARIGRAVTNLYRRIKALYELSASRNAVVNSREAVKHRATLFERFAYPVLCLFISVLTCIAVYCRGQQIRFALVLQIRQKLNLVAYERNAGARLYKRSALIFGVYQLL